MGASCSTTNSTTAKHDTHHPAASEMGSSSSSFSSPLVLDDATAAVDSTQQQPPPRLAKIIPTTSSNSNSDISDDELSSCPAEVDETSTPQVLSTTAEADTMAVEQADNSGGGGTTRSGCHHSVPHLNLLPRSNASDDSVAATTPTPSLGDPRSSSRSSSNCGRTAKNCHTHRSPLLAPANTHNKMTPSLPGLPEVALSTPLQDDLISCGGDGDDEEEWALHPLPHQAVVHIVDSRGASSVSTGTVASGLASIYGLARDTQSVTTATSHPINGVAGSTATAQHNNSSQPTGWGLNLLCTHGDTDTDTTSRDDLYNQLSQWVLSNAQQQA